MKNKYHAALLAVFWVLLAGCDGATYQGEPVSEWIARSYDLNAGTRKHAVLVLADIHGHESVERRLREVASDRREHLEIRMTAAQYARGLGDDVKADVYVAALADDDVWLSAVLGLQRHRVPGVLDALIELHGKRDKYEHWHIDVAIAQQIYLAPEAERVVLSDEVSRKIGDGFKVYLP